MKILFLTRRFFPDKGGVEKHVYEISKALIKSGHDVTIITESQGKEKNIGRIKIVRISKTSKNSSVKLHIWKWLWKNRRLIQEADIIHAHDVLFWYWPFKIIFMSKKCFVTFHGYATYPIKKKAIISRKISEILSDGNIIVGDFIKKWYKTKPNYVIYGGVDLSKIMNHESRIKNQESAVFVGRLDIHTGILDYAKAVDMVLAKFPNFEFKILGEGIYKKKLVKYSQLGFKNNPDKYLQLHNFAFVSRYLSILEALANKRLIFALYDNPVKKDYLVMSPFAKFIIVENNPEELAKKIIYYLNNPKKADKLINQGFKWVKDKTWENVEDTYLKLWKIE
jgi:glycosyltransferase involved in cell wall biosynthesis